MGRRHQTEVRESSTVVSRATRRHQTKVRESFIIVPNRRTNRMMVIMMTSCRLGMVLEFASVAQMEIFPFGADAGVTTNATTTTTTTPTTPTTTTPSTTTPSTLPTPPKVASSILGLILITATGVNANALRISAVITPASPATPG